MDNPKYLTLQEAADILNAAGLRVTPRTLRNWIKGGRIKGYRPGEKIWYISQAEVDRVLKGMQTTSLAPALQPIG